MVSTNVWYRAGVTIMSLYQDHETCPWIVQLSRLERAKIRSIGPTFRPILVHSGAVLTR
jgi:hypothetical protein